MLEQRPVVPSRSQVKPNLGHRGTTQLARPIGKGSVGSADVSDLVGSTNNVHDEASVKQTSPRTSNR